MSHPIHLTINGTAHHLDVAPWTTLLDLLRETMDLHGTKKGCDHGQCGSCTVLIGGHAINACLKLAVTLDAASLVHVDYKAEVPHTELDAERIRAYVPPRWRSGIDKTASNRGDADAALDGNADKAEHKKASSYTHAACFVEVRIDEELGVVRVTRVVCAVAAGRILNPKTARSQILGGVVFGMGMALYEETMSDHAVGRFMNHNLAEYHIASNVDVPKVEVIFVDEHDRMNPLGIKGLGEIGAVPTPAAIANAVFHATGTRVRDLPTTIDKLLTPKAHAA